MSKRQSGHTLLIIVIVVASIVILAVVGFVFWQNFIKSGSSSTVSSFEECKKAPGSTMLLTYPEQCKTIDGQTFTGPTDDSVEYITYCTKAEKLCFEYRDDWNIIILDAPEGEAGAVVDNLAIFPENNTEWGLTLTSGISGLGGTCSEDAATDVTVLESVPISALTGFSDEYNQDMAVVARVIYKNNDDLYTPALYVTTSAEYAKEGVIKACGTGFSQYVTGRNSVVSADYDSAGAFRFAYTGSDFYGEGQSLYGSVDEARAAYETEEYVQGAALLASLRYE